MAASAVFTSSYIYSSQQVGKPEVVADQIFELAPWETPLLSIVGIDSLPVVCTNTQFTWQDLEATPTRTTVATSASATEATLVFTDAIFKAGEQVLVGTETITLGTTSNNLTFAGCTRSSGFGAGAALTAGDKAIGLGKLELQGTAAGTAIGMTMPVQRTNYTSIIMKDVMVSGTAMALPRYGRDGNEYDYQAARKLREAFETLENRVWWGWSQAPSAGTTAGGTQGIYEFVRGVNATAFSGANPTFDNFAAMVETINDYDNSGSDLYAFLPLYTCRQINAWGGGKVQHDIELQALPRMVVGQTVSALMVGDRRVIVVPYRKFQSQGFVINAAKIGVGPMAGRAMSHTYNGITGDRVSGFVLGEYTCSVNNPRAHYVLTGLKAA